MTGRTAPSSRSAAEQALRRLATVPDARYEELLAVPAEHALHELEALSVSLSHWERDRALLRTLVNVGSLLPHEQRFPRDEVYPAAVDDAIARINDELPARFEPGSPTMRAMGYETPRIGMSVPLRVDGRLWGELWVTDLPEPEPGRPDDRLADAARLADELTGMIAVAERLQRMARMAFADPLTGVGNRRAMDDALAELLRPDGPGATVVMVDVDDLKLINDLGGHVAGDRAIVGVADALARAATSQVGSLVSRVGGDEFVVLLRGPDRTAAIEVVDAAARRLTQLPEPVGISCGVAAVAAGAAPADALAAADAALYGAKARGALLMVSSDVTGAPMPRPPRSRGRRAADHGPLAPAQPLRRTPPALEPPADDDTAVAAVTALASIGAALAEAPSSTRSRLAHLAEHLLVPFGLEHWSISRSDLDGPRLLRVSTMAVRQTMPLDHDRFDLHVDTSFRLDDFPLTRHAIEQHRWFWVERDDEQADPAERQVLHEMGSASVVALGCHDERTGWLLELYGARPGAGVRTLGHVASVCLSALLRRPVTPLPVAAHRA
ncbi:GGDEF domain-containing protein [Angustibacter aerolatus]